MPAAGAPEPRASAVPRPIRSASPRTRPRWCRQRSGCPWRAFRRWCARNSSRRSRPSWRRTAPSPGATTRRMPTCCAPWSAAACAARVACAARSRPPTPTTSAAVKVIRRTADATNRAGHAMPPHVSSMRWSGETCAICSPTPSRSPKLWPARMAAAGGRRSCRRGASSYAKASSASSGSWSG